MEHEVNFQVRVGYDSRTGALAFTNHYKFSFSRYDLDAIMEKGDELAGSFAQSHHGCSVVVTASLLLTAMGYETFLKERQQQNQDEIRFEWRRKF